MNLEDVIHEFEIDGATQVRAEDREIYNAVARMFETLADDIVAEFREAEGRRALVWQSVIFRLGIRI